MRLWPGGLMMSRTLGDADAKPFASCVPELRCALLPEHGGRVIVASDGLWDTISGKAAAKLAHAKAPQAAAQLLVKHAAQKARQARARARAPRTSTEKERARARERERERRALHAARRAAAAVVVA